MDRKQFLQTSLLGMAALTVAPSLAVSCASGTNNSKKSANGVLNISCQEGLTPGESLNEKLDFLEGLGVVGLEVNGRQLGDRVTELQDALKNRNIKISAICAGFNGFILAEDPAVKESFDTSMRQIIDAAGALGSTGVIMVPAFNSQTPCKPHTIETRDFLCSQLKELGEYALAHNTTVILEPLNRREAFYLRLVEDAAAICRDAGSEGVKCMGDFWHMQEETSDYAAFMSAGEKYLQHVHIASRGRRLMPGEDPEVDNYENGFRALKELGYQKYVSFECGTKGDRKETLTAAVELIRTQFENA